MEGRGGEIEIEEDCACAGRKLQKLHKRKDTPTGRALPLERRSVERAGLPSAEKGVCSLIMRSSEFVTSSYAQRI